MCRLSKIRFSTKLKRVKILEPSQFTTYLTIFKIPTSQFIASVTQKRLDLLHNEKPNTAIINQQKNKNQTLNTDLLRDKSLPTGTVVSETCKKINDNQISKTA